MQIPVNDICIRNMDSVSNSGEKTGSSRNVVSTKNAQDHLDTITRPLMMADARRKLLITIMWRQQQFFGHAARKKIHGRAVCFGEIEGKRDRGRRRLTG